MNTSSRLSPNFSLREFIASTTAARLKIDNSLPDALKDNATHTCEQLEKVRRLLDNHPVVITSGWRAPALNKAVGGSAGSDHAKARAVDIRCPKFGTARTIARVLAASNIEFDQLILESPNTYSAWVHIGFRKGANRRQVLTKFAGDKTYYAGLKS
ncbi:D-Ala-D-Ala carboxypeptidase family metallohydrolase [Iodobacter sp. CM08]|uniref:D-Ala-D-Ala carboxypeptidase family metallohydrolase n=1 Tax=Iodobacter sp. CM08 TaxID=3085902 RepID=UPI00298196E6|nr:D-Ala-D-Ala carboxypeptidase family metallohydrolase [Iodobacter sp. CM08]MDW5418893.1 D-Ala-D-Ala carboxypeptidase family metallohydrolase [Iodobacter sp. CM08]